MSNPHAVTIFHPRSSLVCPNFVTATASNCGGATPDLPCMFEDVSDRTTGGQDQDRRQPTAGRALARSQAEAGAVFSILTLTDFAAVSSSTCRVLCNVLLASRFLTEARWLFSARNQSAQHHSPQQLRPLPANGSGES